MPEGIVVEIDEDVPSPFQVSPDPIRVARQFPLAVLRCIIALTAVAADIDEIGGERRLDQELRPVGHAEGDIVFPAEGSGFSAEPALLPEFQGVSDRISVEQFKEALQALTVGPEAGWKLPEDRPELLLQRQGRAKEAFQRLLRVAQPLYMGDEAAPLEAEDEAGRRLQPPLREGRRFGEAIEGDVQLHA